jgi:hypothetical protein
MRLQTDSCGLLDLAEVVLGHKDDVGTCRNVGEGETLRSACKVWLSVNSRRRRGLDWEVTLNPVFQQLRFNQRKTTCAGSRVCGHGAASELVAMDTEHGMMEEVFAKFGDERGL